jgi:hypothetical protein
MAATKKVKKPTLKDRLTNPAYLAAVSGFTYNAYQVAAKKNGLPEVDLGTFQLAVDLLSYLLIGVGIHSTFTSKTE